LHIRSPALVLAGRPHGETGSVVRLLTPENGVVAAYVAGGRGRRMRPVILAGNKVATDIRARSVSQLPFATLELVASRAAWLAEPLLASAIDWACALTASALPEHAPYRVIHDALDALIDAVISAPAARGWMPGMISYERLLLRELGYGRTRASLPDDFAGQLDRFAQQGRAIEHYLLADAQRPVMAARERLLARLERVLA
jgi:DNA repair protein RecO (recombination protein O)